MDTQTKVLPAAPYSAADRRALYRTILERRDVRSEFLPDPIPDEILGRLLTAAHHAPSVGFMQPWSFILIRETETKRHIHDLFLKANADAALMFPEDKRQTYRSLKLEGIMEAPLNLCITCDRDRAGPVVIGRTHIPAMDLFSSVCAVQNLWLAARAEGLGVGWVSILDADGLQEALAIPPREVPVAYLCLGRVSGFHAQPELASAGWRSRLPLADLIHFDGWGRRDATAPLLDRLRSDQQAVAEGLFLETRV
ncbi:MAG: 5,6-dimethylbenzimidazole synthase [Magnetospirillum sp. WYHS-4]